MEIYNSLADPSTRTEFLKEFDANAKGDLKWVGKFEKTITGNKKTTVSINENFLTRICGILNIMRIIF